MLRSAEKWGAGYLASIRRRRSSKAPVHVLFCVANHFEPFVRTVLPSGVVTGGCETPAAREAVRGWLKAYAASVDGVRDADGRPPVQTFFYPWDEYDSDCLDLLADGCRTGLGEVEIHLHHRNDTAEGLRTALTACRDVYAGRHGMLGRTVDNTPRFGFVHGNWALCNSRPDGDWCGVDQELSILRETGCYADFTFPSAPSPTQPAMVNTVYYGRDPLSGERGHRHAAWVVAGQDPLVAQDERTLLMVPGPLGLNWRSRRFGFCPRLENGELSAVNPATVQRLALWLRLQVHVIGRPEWVIVKLHTHGMSPLVREGILGPAMRRFYEALAGVNVHFVTARELFNIIKAAEAGHTGNPGTWRDFIIKPPPASYIQR